MEMERTWRKNGKNMENRWRECGELRNDREKVERTWRKDGENAEK